MQYTARQLAMALDVEPSTITRHIKKSKVSATKNERGEWIIDASEAMRAYGDRLRIDDAGNVAAKGSMQNDANRDATAQSEVLHAKLEALSKENILLREQLTDTKDDREHWRQQAERTTALLEDKRKQNAQPDRGRFSRAWAVLWGNV